MGILKNKYLAFVLASSFLKFNILYSDEKVNSIIDKIQIISEDLKTLEKAFYKNSDIIIFDEATNALDQSTEIKIFNNLAKEFDKTFLIINHREINSNFQLKTLVVENKSVIKK